MNRPILSISIPSNNKTDLLLNAIDSIVDEIKHTNNIKLNISDNSANQENKKIINDKYKNLNFINYYKSEHKTLDSNVNNSINICDSEYVWIFGDDDIIHKDIINPLINYLSSHSPDVLILNSSSFIEDYIIEKSRSPFNKNIEYSCDKESNDLFLSNMGGYLTYIGGIIVKKKTWINNYNQKYLDTYFSHLAVVLNAKINNCKIHYFSKPCIKMRLNSQTWTDKYFEIWNHFYPNVIWGFSEFSEKAKSSVIAKYPYNNILRIFTLKAYGRISFKIYKKYIFKNPACSYYIKFLSFLIMLIPRKISSLIYYLFIKLFKNKHTSTFSPKLAIKLLQL